MDVTQYLRTGHHVGLEYSQIPLDGTYCEEGPADDNWLKWSVLAMCVFRNEAAVACKP